MRFAAHRTQKDFPNLTVETASVRDLRGDTPIDVLVVSHVVNELDEAGRADLAALIARSTTVLWVEPGTYDVSRTLVAWREKLRGDFRVIAPCTHQAPCGLLAPANERHWCHHFAAPPSEIFANSDWVRFGQRAGIDLRSLPYSFLVLDKRTASSAAESGLSRILGEPRHFKGFAKIFNCSADGVEELTLQKRDSPELFKELKRPAGALIYRWTRENERIVAGNKPLV
jgi:ribosomal protein RSM22 (predicted rRNA methylase)